MLTERVMQISREALGGWMTDRVTFGLLGFVIAIALAIRSFGKGLRPPSGAPTA
jgi:hypothetical protein